ncbi:hypothetical protein NPIL_567771 [Nephila pilipes]|uniref:Uncharacterized protein n=1 Tax=Nephila pilipes TaxID=299642 RepID=A0A8X6NEW8_NEPPI|nr:hypothetical protein NPIL_567771 [Nephila pilipes]
MPETSRHETFSKKEIKKPFRKRFFFLRQRRNPVHSVMGESGAPGRPSDVTNNLHEMETLPITETLQVAVYRRRLRLKYIAWF